MTRSPIAQNPKLSATPPLSEVFWGPGEAGRALFREAQEIIARKYGSVAVATKPAKPARKPRQSSPDGGLQTAAQAAAKLNCSTKTLNAHVAAGDLRYVIIGKGTKRPRRMFSVADLDNFIANQTRKEPPCLSDATRGRRSGSTTSKSEIIAFSGVQKRRRDAKPKR